VAQVRKTILPARTESLTSGPSMFLGSPSLSACPTPTTPRRGESPSAWRLEVAHHITVADRRVEDDWAASADRLRPRRLARLRIEPFDRQRTTCARQIDGHLASRRQVNQVFAPRIGEAVPSRAQRVMGP